MPPEEITRSNHPSHADIKEQLDRVESMLALLLEEWRKYEPVVAAFGRGGLLAARTAAKNGRRS